MDKEKYYKYMFLFSACYNVLISSSFIIVSVAMTDLFDDFGVPIPPSMLWLQLSLGLIIIFGIGYIIVAKDLSQNHGIVIIGGISKVLFFLLTLGYYIYDLIDPSTHLGLIVVLLGGFDIVLVCLFTEFLLKYGK